MKRIYYLLIILLSSYQTYSQVHVKGYYRKNGTYVSPHTRSSPNSSVYDNYSYKGNINPYTGAAGHRTYTSTYGKRDYRKVYSKKVTLPKSSYFYTVNGGSSMINSISANKDVEIIGEADNNYYLIKYGEKEGFIDKRFIADSDRTIRINDLDTTAAIFTPLINIDTLRGKPAKIVVPSAILREYSESNDSNIIKRIPFGSNITVLYADINSFWVVKHEESIGVMLDVFFSYDVIEKTNAPKKRPKLFDFLKFKK